MVFFVLKQIWNKRRSNGWLFAELFIVFIILWYVVDFLLTTFVVSHQYKGYDTHRVYHVSIVENPDIGKDYKGEARRSTFLQLFNRIKEYPGVESACYYGGTVPYEKGSVFQSYTTDSIRTYRADIRMVSKEFFDVFKVRIDEGSTDGWDIQAYPRPAVISKDLADSLFAGKAKPGKEFFDYYWPPYKYTVGGIAPLTKLTEYDRYAPFIYVPVQEWMLENWAPLIAVRIREGMEQGFTERFAADMRNLNVGPFYFSRIKAYNEAKEIHDTQTDNYIRTAYAVVFFFVFNVFLSIAGTFWFRTRKRRGEIGLLMALGASKKSIAAELLSEGMLIFLLAVVPAILCCFNIWLAGITVNTFMDATLPRFLAGTSATLLLMLAMICLGVLYPALQATRTKPAEALHDE